MKVNIYGLTLVMASALAVWACETNNPTRPSVTFAAPTAQQPSNGIVYNFNQQPVTLQIVNSVTTGTKPVVYNVEVSTSSGFGSTVYKQDGIAEGSGGITSVQLPELPGNTTYYWRWKAVIDGIVGEPSAIQNFLVRPKIVIQAPIPQSPVNGLSLFAPRPTFVVVNANTEGSPDTVLYDFELSASASFASLIASATVQEQANVTSWTPPVDLPEGNIFWRVRAKHLASAVTGPYSASAQFERRFGIDLSKVIVAWPPSAAVMKTWPETAKLRSVYFQTDDTETLCTEYDDPGWPEALYFGGPSTVYANQWIFVNRNGTWYAGAAAWMRPWPQFCKKDYDQAFFMDSLGGVFPFNETVLHSGDIIGVMMNTPARAYPDMRTVDERSNIVLVAWPPGR